MNYELHNAHLLCMSLMVNFLSDPGVPGVRSMGPVVSNWVSEYETFCKLNWCDSGWWRYQRNAPRKTNWQCSDSNWWKNLVVKYRTYEISAIWWPNLKPIHEVSLKSISNSSSWETDSSNGLNAQGPLYLWLCYIYLYLLYYKTKKKRDTNLSFYLHDHILGHHNEQRWLYNNNININCESF